LLVGHQTRQLADQRQGILWYRPPVLTDPIPSQPQRGVVPSLPV
jgi:hypothetical protein